MKNWIGTILIIMIVLAGFLQSCTTERKALDYFKNNPKSGAEYCANTFPATEKFIKGKDSIREVEIIVKGDSVNCPDVKTTSGETISGGKAKCSDQKVIYLDKWHTPDTIVKTDEAKLAVLRIDNEKLRIDLGITKDSLLKADKEANRWLWSFIGLVALCIAYGFLKFKRIL